MTHSSLFEPYALGPLTLANRIVMAPLTRNRAGAGPVAGQRGHDDAIGQGQGAQGIGLEQRRVGH